MKEMIKWYVMSECVISQLKKSHSLKWERKDERK